MNSKLKWLIILLGGGIVAYAILWFLSIYMGWYGYEQWKYRKATLNVDEAIRRGVFVRKLEYKVEDFPDTFTNFIPYIEKGFKWGHHSSEKTVPLEGTNYPYQLSFNSRPSQQIGIFIKKNELQKFDSSGTVWGYLKEPILPDTVILEIRGENVKSGIIKVW